MSTTRIRRATAADDAPLRALTAGVAMPGAVTVAFAREPSYFLATSVLGDPCEVLVAERGGAIVAVACRAVRPVLLRGERAEVWTIGNLRVAPEARDRTLLTRGARYFRATERPGALGFAVIARDNPRARGALTGPRAPAGLRVVRVDGLSTFALLVRPPRRHQPPAGTRIAFAAPEDEGALLAFWAREGARRNFFPITAPGDVGGPALRGLGFADVAVAWREGRVVGTIAVWDQSWFEQEVVVGYGPALARWRPLVDAVARILSAQPLPRVGAAIPLVTAARVCVEHDDPRTLRALLHAALARAHEFGAAFLMVGACDHDPLARVLRAYPHVTYRSDLLALAWDRDPAEALDDRVAYVEIAAL